MFLKPQQSSSPRCGWVGDRRGEETWRCYVVALLASGGFSGSCCSDCRNTFTRSILSLPTAVARCYRCRVLKLKLLKSIAEVLLQFVVVTLRVDWLRHVCQKTCCLLRCKCVVDHRFDGAEVFGLLMSFVSAHVLPVAETVSSTMWKLINVKLTAQWCHQLLFILVCCAGVLQSWMRLLPMRLGSRPTCCGCGLPNELMKSCSFWKVSSLLLLKTAVLGWSIVDDCWWGRLVLQTVADNDPGVIILSGEECEGHQLENIHLYIYIFHIH